MAKKAQSFGSCDMVTGMIGNIIMGIIQFILQIISLLTCGSFSTKIPFVPFELNLPLGPLGVISIVGGALATNTISLTVGPFLLAIVGIVLIGSLVLKVR